jgi:hypothetical protein
VGNAENGLHYLRKAIRMKGFIEEYGGVIVACLMGLLILGIISSCITDGTFVNLIKMFFQGVGTTVTNWR